MSFSATKCFAPTELGSLSVVVVDKHLVPLGPKTTATKIQTGLLHELSSQDTGNPYAESKPSVSVA